MVTINRVVNDRKGRGIVLAALLAAGACLLPLTAASYQLVDLGADITPSDINNYGAITGSRNTGTGTVGFIRPAGGVVQDLAFAISGNAVNDAGLVTGNTATGAFLYNGSLQQWSGYSAYGINAGNQLSGNVALDNPYQSSPQPLDPAIYTPDRWDNLGIATLYPRGTVQGAYADLFALFHINDAGYAVGIRRRYGLSGSAAILTTPAFGDVTYLPVPNGGYAKSINGHNRIVGATGSNLTTGEYVHAFLYDFDASSYQDLGTLNGGLSSSASDINEYDQIVGSSWLATSLTSTNDPTQYHACIWRNGVISDLNDELPAGSGWVLTDAIAINDAGDIVGTGLLNGARHGFLLSAATLQAPQNLAPVAVAGSDVSAGKAPLTVQFNGNGSYDPDGTLTDWSWNFGDQTGATGASATHVYTTPGVYNAVLTVTDNRGQTAVAQVQITVRKSRGR